MINTHYALEAGLAPGRDAPVIEGRESPYANLVVTRPELANDPRLWALLDALHHPEPQRFITERFGGAIVPVK